jgi:hypothetical protein
VPHPELLTAGPLSLELDGDDVRAVRFGDQEVVRRIYVGVRTPSWATVPGTVRDRVIAADGDRVRVELVTDHRQDDLAVEVRVVLVLDPDGELSYHAQLEALSAFEYNRMGICVLHPAEASAGVPYWARGTDGEISGRLPRLIAPQDVRGGQNQPLFPAFEELELELGDVRTRLTCAGDRFETEDQRNWTDASFKTYSTPSGLGLPHAIAPGAVLAQQVTIAFLGRPRPRQPVPAEVQLGVDGTSGRTLPAVGVALPADVPALAALAPAHLRVRLDLTGPEEVWRAALGEAARAAAAARAGLEVALLVQARSRGALPAAAAALGDVAVPLHRLLVFPGEGGVTDDAWLRELREVVSPAVPGVPLGGGAEGDFADVNRAVPRAALDLLSWGIDPQVHASDARSIMETPPTQGLAVRTAMALRPDAGFALGPLAVGPGRRLDAGLGPAWAALSVKHLAEAGVAAVTFGLAGSGAPASLEALAGRDGDEVLSTTSTDPARADVLAVRGAERTRMLLVNPTPEPPAVELRHADDAPRRRLTLKPYAVEVVDA